MRSSYRTIAQTEAFENVELVGYQHAETALKSGRGAILLGCLQTHTGFGVRHPRLAQWKVTMVRPAAASDAYGHDGPKTATVKQSISPRFRRRDWRVYWKVLNAMDAWPFRTTFRIRRQSVFPAFSWDARLGLAIARQAYSADTAPVLPVNVVRLQPFSSRKIRVEIHPPLPFDDLAECKPDRESAALRLSVATECLIRRYPVQWTHWTALAQRWQEAQSVDRPPGSLTTDRGLQNRRRINPREAVVVGEPGFGPLDRGGRRHSQNSPLPGSIPGQIIARDEIVVLEPHVAVDARFDAPEVGHPRAV